MIIKTARKLIVFVVGMTVVLIGIVMVVTPGPAVVVVPIGLGILATEFVWARVLLKHIREHAAGAVRRVQSGGRRASAGRPDTAPQPADEKD